MRSLATIMAIGLLATAAATAQTYEYDGVGRLTSVRYSDGSIERYTYDANGNITRIEAAVASVEETESTALELRIEARPNPSAGNAMLVYSLERGADVELAITDARGDIIMSRSIAAQPAGEHSLEWTATTSDGAPLADGVYIATIEARSDDGIRNGAVKIVVAGR